MARWVKALGNPIGRSILLGHGRTYIAAAILLVWMIPSLGATEEQVKWDPIPGSNLKLQDSARSKDDAGAPSSRDPALSVRALGRSPTSYQPAVIHPFKLAEKHHLTPVFSLNYDDAGGEAGKSRAADFKLTYSYIGDPLILVVNTLIEHGGYDRKYPAFGKTGRDDSYGVSASVYYTNPWEWSLFGSEAIRIFATGTYSYTDSKADFFKQESVSGAAGISLEW